MSSTHIARLEERLRFARERIIDLEKQNYLAERIVKLEGDVKRLRSLLERANYYVVFQINTKLLREEIREELES